MTCQADRVQSFCHVLVKEPDLTEWPVFGLACQIETSVCVISSLST
jgi:hypothetical protein